MDPAPKRQADIHSTASIRARAESRRGQTGAQIMDEEPGKKWPERRRDHQAGHRQGKRQAVGATKLADEAAGIAGERNEGLHPALRPAAALRQPGIEPGWCLFLRARWQNADVEAEARETKAEIGIFRHVPGIPAADFAQNPCAEMIG